MNFTRHGQGFRVSRVTGPTHNFLQIQFLQNVKESKPDALVVDGRAGSQIRNTRVLDSAKVLQSVLKGVERANLRFGMSLVVEQALFLSDDSPPEEVYAFLAESIAERISLGLPFGGSSA